MILSTLLAVAALHASPQPVLAPQNTPEATAEGLEILRRLLVESLEDAFQEESEAQATVRGAKGYQGNLVTRLWVGNHTVQHSRAFHLPSAGAFFSIDASLPVVAKSPAAQRPDDAEKPTDDEWERARREVRGDQAGEGTFFRRLQLATPVAAEIDPKAIDRVVDVALRTLSRHASRVEGLAQRETITVALRLDGRSRGLMQHFGDDEHEFGFGFETPEAPEPLDGSKNQQFAYVLSAGHDVREQNLVLRIAVGDLASETNVDRLRERAQINLY